MEGGVGELREVVSDRVHQQVVQVTLSWRPSDNLHISTTAFYCLLYSRPVGRRRAEFDVYICSWCQKPENTYFYNVGDIMLAACDS